MAEKNYYDILGVDKKASESDIKKAYRKLVRQYHPDVSDDPNADAKMGEINNAYETLKDAEKRAQYDVMLDNPFMGQGGFNGYGGAGGANMRQEDLDEILRQFGGGGRGGFNRGGAGFRFDDIFSAFGGGGSFGDASMGGGMGGNRSTKGEDQHAELSVDLNASYEGETRKITLSLPVRTATGMDYQNKTIEVKIPKGIAEGQQIRLAKQGNPSPYGGENGDLYLKIKFNHPDNIRVEGKDIFQTVDIAPWEAVLNGKITVNTPAGKVSVNVPKNSRTGTNLRLKGKGIPAAKEPGDLYLTINIVLPPLSTNEKTNEEQLQAWQFLKDAFNDFTPNR
jgi:curved DNA-binding protein